MTKKEKGPNTNSTPGPNDRAIEDQKILRCEAFKFMAGGIEYTVTEPTLQKDSGFRKALGAYVGSIVPKDSGLKSMTEGEKGAAVIAAAFTEGFDTLTDLLWAYDPSLPKSKILKVASMQEMAVACERLAECVLPLVGPILRVRMQVLNLLKPLGS